MFIEKDIRTISEILSSSHDSSSSEDNNNFLVTLLCNRGSIDTSSVVDQTFRKKKSRKDKITKRQKHKIQKRFTSISRVTFWIWVVTVVLLSMLPSTSSVDTSVTGEWQVNLRSGNTKWIFPNKVSDSLCPLPGPGGGWKHRQLHSCHLSMYSNGTFVLQPTSVETPSTTITAAEDSSTPWQKMVLRGRWYVENNPYCATDRFYQNIHLMSYPRYQQSTANDREMPEQQPLNRHQLMLHGRLWGQYSRKESRLTHGKIVLSPTLQESPRSTTRKWWEWSPQRQPVILGSFQAELVQPWQEEDDNTEFNPL
jgi:hypothetical protein